MSTPTPNVSPLVKLGTAAHSQLYNKVWHRTEAWPAPCTCKINPMQSEYVKPSIDDAWKYVPDTAWGPCLQRFAQTGSPHEIGGGLTLRCGTKLEIGIRVILDGDVSSQYEEGKSGEWVVEGYGANASDPDSVVVRIKERTTGVYCLAPSHWLTGWKEPQRPDLVAAASFFPLQLAFVIEPTNDERITCFLCKKPKCSHEFTFRDSDRISIGVHATCASRIDGVGDLHRIR